MALLCIRSLLLRRNRKPTVRFPLNDTQAILNASSGILPRIEQDINCGTRYKRNVVTALRPLSRHRWMGSSSDNLKSQDDGFFLAGRLTFRYSIHFHFQNITSQLQQQQHLKALLRRSIQSIHRTRIRIRYV